MAACQDLIKSEFPKIDDDLYQYVEGILENGVEDFEDSAEVYDAIGEVLHEVADEKSEKEIRDICNKLLRILRPDKGGGGGRGGGGGGGALNDITGGAHKVLNAPVHLASMAANLENNVTDIKSIWVMQRDDSLKVDQKKLEKAEAKLQAKQERRAEQLVTNRSSSAVTSSNSGGGGQQVGAGGGGQLMPALQAATASQATSKKEAKMEAKGCNRTQDIRIENFDVAYGERVLLQAADIVLAYGRRYGLVGRNGIGKTTLLRMISSGQLRIPSHISILHVEQEVVGDDTPALESVLECDIVRHTLLKREQEINALINNKSVPYLTIHTFTTFFYALSICRPDLLLLDEPTNMLDMKAIIWLETYLQNWPTTLLVVSHDRHFLDTVPTDILHLHTQRIDSYRGNYDNFAKTKQEKLKNQQREWEAQQQHRAHVQEFIDRFRYNANRASSVQSKIKMLERLPELKNVEKEVEVVLKFPETEPLSPPILQLNEVCFSYVKGKPILTNVNLGATLESRICIVGDNGAGKTTLLKLIMGLLSPSSGDQHTHRAIKFGYFSQHHVDQLAMGVSSVELLQQSYPGKPVEEYRRQLGSFGVSGDLALQTVGSLSGGQKSRVAFARMCMASPNFLVLDEPTNHLDIETIEALGKAINKYNGGVILVSHDERLIRMVCKELWVCGGGTVTSIEGGFDEYRRIVERELAETNK
ncbi:ATP-binding cassette sub-family F member 3 [Nilaparvata lugens]|uniref:ATP-binding cassette sub-family F member 3 n=2 Tax=Nilaparvata lugens TaxID=108931 RepID=UPI00193D728A|nr:ATP-binding cassette sub-family F member 3 [Nilaparvata lugens]